MNFVAQLEEYLRDLGVESRKKHPGVKEASERAILKLRTLQNDYVSAVRKANNGERHPDTTLFRSSDLLHPFLLAANYPNASPRLLDTSFKAMKTLMEANAICPGDGMNMVRVWMIQAQVVVSYSSKESSISNAVSAVSGSHPGDPSGDSANSAQSTGWFGGLLSSSSSNPSALERTTLSVSTKTAVSSSHGQAGSGRLNAKDLEKLAMDIMSCLLQLLELRDLPVTAEQWIQSITLCCLLYLPSRQNVRQAAHSTLPQVLSLLVRDKEAFPLALKTWDDLLTCAVGWDNITQSNSAQTCNLQGAFRQCRMGDKDSAYPPSPALSLELMTTILKEAPQIFSKMGQKTLGVTVQVLLKQSTTTNAAPLEYSRAVQFVLVLLQTQAKEWPNECRELIARLIQPIPIATEALRNQADFEDGYVYNISNKNLAASTANLETLQGLPPTILWKSSLSLEVLHSLVQDKTLEDVWLHPDVVVSLLEATSDLCTIGASCQEHINLFILASRKKEHGLSYSAESLSSLTLWKNGKTKDEKYILGDALWIGLSLILKVVESLNEAVLEASFAPALAVLQHYLKRLPASGIIVKRALEGYFSLAKVSLRLPLLRNVLLSSLCKLSLPKWGTQDPACPLKDHHIAALICLLNVVHRFHDNIGSEWSVVLQTFQELSNVAIASPHLSDRAYVGALSISAVYSRFASFSTCLADESLVDFVKGLREAAVLDQTSNVIANPVRGADVLRIPSKPKDSLGKDDKGTIGDKILSIGVRAIYGNNDGSSPQTDDVPLTERTKNTYFHDYQIEFSRRLGSSKHPVRLDLSLFALALFADVAMTNSFRHGRCGATVLRELCALATESPSARLFAMDMVSMLTISHLAQSAELPAAFAGPGKIVYEDPRQNQYLAAEQIKDIDSSDSMSISQVGLFGPLCEFIRQTTSASAVESGLEALHSVLESSGHELSAEAWNEIIQAVASIPSTDRSSADWSESCLIGFRCLKLIVDDFLDEMGSATVRASLLDCCSSFGSSRHDVNTSLTAIGLLWTIADQDAGTTSIDLALSKLVILSSDLRAEVRNCSVNTLFSCIAGRGQTFTGNQWQACICNMILAVYDLVLENAGIDDEGEYGTKTNPGDRSRYRVSIHHSRDSAGKQWMATQALVLKGLSRVMRTFFPSLLDTTDDGSGSGEKKNDTPWFEQAWNTILSHSFDAAAQTGGRDTLDLRSSGVELLVLCNQLACRAGIQAAITPARVGTNMEVVNGALRSVRSPENIATSSKKSPQRSHSTITETWRENLFLDAFEVLDSFREYLESDSSSDKESALSPYMEPTQVQVLSHFADDLNRLYDCCKDGEFMEDKSFNSVISLKKELTLDPPSVSDEDTLVARFVRIVMTVATKSSGGPEARFLSQAQRSCIDLLRSMASNGSSEAFINLSSLSSEAFFREREENGKAKKGVDILSHEASNVLCEEIPNENVSDECRVLILCRLFLALLGGDDCDCIRFQSDELSYKLLTPLMAPCLKSAKELERNIESLSNAHDATLQLLDVLWERLCMALAKMLSPISDGSKIVAIPHALDLVDLVKNISQFPSTRYSSELCGILSTGALKCLEAAKIHSFSQANLKLFGSCFGGICQLDSADESLPVIAKQVFAAAEHSRSDESSKPEEVRSKQFNVEACVMACQIMQDTLGIERVVISVFPSLCQLVGAEESPLRDSVGRVLSLVNVGKVLEDTQLRCETAERRAHAEEKKVTQLSSQLEQLLKEKEALERQLAFIG